MSKKRLITMFVSLLVIITLCVLGGAVFVVKDIEVVRMDKFLDANDSITNEDIIEKTKISKGKSIFAISESNVVSLIEENFPTIKVKGIERVFPNKVIIKLTERVPVLVIKFKGHDEYLVLDNNMCAIDTINSKDLLELEKHKQLTMVDGFELDGAHKIKRGKQLPAENYGGEVVVVQQIVQGLLQHGLSPEDLNSVFLKKINFINTGSNEKIVYIETKMGVIIKLDYTNMNNDNNLIFDRIPYAYDLYVALEDEEQKSSGFIVFDEEYYKASGEIRFIHKANI